MYQLFLTIPLFRNSPGNFLDEISKHAYISRFHPGHKIIIENTEGHEFYIILSGSVLVSKSKEGSPEDDHLATLSKHDYFGEVALISNTVRNASVTALQKTECIVIDRDSFHSVRSHINFPKRRAIFSSHDLQAYSPAVTHPTQKSARVEDIILSCIRSNVVVGERLQEGQLEKMVECAFMRQFAKGEEVVKQGAEGHHFYMIESGSFSVRKDGKDVAKLKKGQSFGEMALFYNRERAASVVCKEKSVCWLIHRMHFRTAVLNISKEKFEKINEVISKTSCLQTLLESERMTVASLVKEKIYKEHEVVVKEGEEGNCMFIIVSGTALVTKKNASSSVTSTPNSRSENKEGSSPSTGNNDSHSSRLSNDNTYSKETLPRGEAEENSYSTEKTTVLNRLGPYDYFGEMALITGEKRVATVTAVNGPLEVLVLSASAFNTYCSPLREVMERKFPDYPEEIPKPSRLKSDLFRSVQLEDFQIMEELGRGSFGKVLLVKVSKERLKQMKKSERDEIISSGSFALKAIRKYRVKSTGQVNHVINERMVLEECASPFIVELYATYRSHKCIYLLMEACLGGELFARLRSHGAFTETVAKFYLANVIEAIDYLHSKNIVFRDLKPENILIGNDGYIKLTDFGFAKRIETKTWTLCGTPDYLAPEVIEGTGHEKPADIWTLGVLLYELLVSFPPFYSSDQRDTYRKILSKEPEYPKFLSEQAKDLISKLMKKREYDRLGTKKEGLDEVRAHPFFEGIDWEKIRNKVYVPPHEPIINHETDTSNFLKGSCVDHCDGYSDGDSCEMSEDETKESEWEKYF